MKMPDLVICNESVKYMPSDSIWDQWFSCPLPNDDEVGGNYGIRVSWARGDALDRSKRNCGGKTLEDHVKSWVRRKLESGVPQSRCSFPFLVGARKMVEKECLCCGRYIFPGEEIECSIRGCGGVYHGICAKKSLGFSGHRTFKCPQHECFICKQRLHWKSIRCTLASHEKCAPWPDKVVHLKNQPGTAICWRHPSDWHVDLKSARCSSDECPSPRQVEGETRVGVFAARSIEVGEPLTYDYRFVQFGPEVKCHCGAPNCQRCLGTKKRSALDLFWGTKRQQLA